MIAKGEEETFEAVLENLEKRDYEDSTRADSPLLKAKDAKVLDNSELNRKQQFEIVLAWAQHEIQKPV
jgi:cytidylate kinase